jgi:hypothetical protein
MRTRLQFGTLVLPVRLYRSLVKLEHLMSCNSKNSSSPPFKDDGPDNTPLSGTTGHGNRLGEHKDRLLLEISHDRPG